MYGAIIKELRNEKGWTQKDLAEKLNSNQKNISKYESESLDLSTDLVLRLADIFDVSVDYLLGRETDFVGTAPKTPTAEHNLSADEMELIEDFRKLNFNQQGAIKIQVKALAEQGQKV